MKQLLISRATAVFFLCAASTAALAHEGHGAATGIHWHATDTLGFLVVVVLASAAVWLSRGGK